MSVTPLYLLGALAMLALLARAATACGTTLAPPLAADAAAGTDSSTVSDGGTPTGFGVNEVSGKGEEWVEIFNGGPTVVDVSGFRVVEGSKDDAGGPKSGGFAFPPNTTLPPGTYVVVMGVGEGGVPCVAPAGTPCFQASFSISNTSGETMYFIAPDGGAIDKVEYPANVVQSGRSWGRIPNGTGGFQVTTKTPGAPNKP